MERMRIKVGEKSMRNGSSSGGGAVAPLVASARATEGIFEFRVLNKIYTIIFSVDLSTFVSNEVANSQASSFIRTSVTFPHSSASKYIVIIFLPCFFPEKQALSDGECYIVLIII